MGIRRMMKRWSAYHEAVRDMNAGPNGLNDLGLGDIDRIGQHAPASFLIRLGR